MLSIDYTLRLLQAAIEAIDEPQNSTVHVGDDEIDRASLLDLLRAHTKAIESFRPMNTMLIDEQMDKVVQTLGWNKARQELMRILRAVQFSVLHSPSKTGHVTIEYTNYRGELDVRKIAPMYFHFGKTEFHPEPQFLLKAWAFDRNAERDFAVRDIHNWSIVEG